MNPTVSAAGAAVDSVSTRCADHSSRPERLPTRRSFFKLAAGGVCSLIPTRQEAVAAAAEDRRSADWIDVNATLSRWPLRRVAGDDTPALVEKFRAQGITQAWVGSFDGLLHKDLAAVNTRLAAESRRHGRGLLKPFGSVNPKAPDWEEELRRCAEVHQMPGIRLHPNYHGYRLDDPAFARLLHLATEHRLLVQIALVMEDERMMHPLLRVEPVDTKPLVERLRQTPGARLILLNALGTLRARPLLDVLAAGEVFVEIAMLEGLGGLGTLLGQLPAGRVLFGSHAPLFYLEAAALKLKESPLSDAQLHGVRFASARGLLQRRA